MTEAKRDSSTQTQTENTFKTYSLQETAQILGIAPRTMHDYIKAGRIKGQKIGGHWRISEKNLQRFIDGE